MTRFCELTAVWSRHELIFCDSVMTRFCDIEMTHWVRVWTRCDILSHHDTKSVIRTSQTNSDLKSSRTKFVYELDVTNWVITTQNLSLEHHRQKAIWSRHELMAQWVRVWTRCDRLSHHNTQSVIRTSQTNSDLKSSRTNDTMSPHNITN